MNRILRKGPVELATVALLCLWHPAPAAAGVITYATSNLVVPHTGDYYGITYGYNATGVGGGVGFGVNNSITGGTCEVSSCSGAGTGTLDTSGLLTSSFDQSSALASDGAGGSFSSSAYAVADLASGTVGVAASGTLYQNVGGLGGAYAEVDDTLNFSAGGAGASDVTDITVTYSLDGTYSGTPGVAGVSTALFFGNADLQYYLASDGTVHVQSNAGWVSSGFLSTSASNIVFTGIYALTGPATNNLGVQLHLYANCGQGSSCDYSHTGVIGLNLPGNVTFNSGSGVFLTQTTPEPASVWLLAAGLLGIGLRTRFQIARRRIRKVL